MMANASVERAADNSAKTEEAPEVQLASLRVILLVTLFMFGNYWLGRHVGIGFDGPAWGFLLAGSGLAFTLVESYFGDWKKGKLREITAFVIRFPMLLALWAALLLASMVCSSITVVSDNSGETLSVTVTDLNGSARNEDNSKEKGGPVHFYHLWTTPLGENYRVSVPGYLVKVVEVYPITGATVISSRDLQVAPAVLFRPPELALGPMGGTVRVEVYETKNGNRSLLTKDESVGPHSILVGHARPVPLSYLDSWRMEALAQGIRDERELAKVLQDWKTPQAIGGEIALEPNTDLELIVYNPSNQVLATGKVRLSSEPFQDVPLELAH